MRSLWRLKAIVCAATTIVLVVLGACSSRDLTREKASRLIEEGQQFTTGFTQIDLNAFEIDTGIRRGYWTSQNTLLGQQLTLTPTKWPDNDGFGGFGSQGFGSVTLRLRKPAGLRLVQVTGITDDPGGADKVAEFSWSLKADDLSSAEKDVLSDQEESPAPNEPVPPLGTGVAVFKLYDDGWRLQDLKLTRPRHDAPVRGQAPMGD